MAADDPRGLPVREGERRHNWTGRPWYQLASSLRHPCPECPARHGRVLPRRWGLPFHPDCQCEELEILPGGDAPIRARPPRELVNLLDESGRAAIPGRENLVLPRHDVVGYPQLFDDRGDPPPFERVVKSAGLTPEQLTGAGILEPLARSVLGP
jgi:hypothetical protein